MRSLVLLFILSFSSFVEARCNSFAAAEQLLDSRRFLENSRAHIARNEERRLKRLPPESEQTLQLGDINQARNYALNFPAIRNLGFPAPGPGSWSPHIKRAVGGSEAGGLRDGWKINHNGRYAVVRLDYDPAKGMHYNIELEDARGQMHKLAVQFNCNNRPCSESDYLRAVRALNSR